VGVVEAEGGGKGPWRAIGGSAASLPQSLGFTT